MATINADDRPAEDIGRKFEAAWEVFSRTCGDAVAPEATFQAWFAHYLISQFGIDRVAREVDFGHHKFSSERTPLFKGWSVHVDVVVLRRPGVNLPHRAFTPDGTGADRLADLAVISEFKVASTSNKGLRHSDVHRDFHKLSMLLEEADHRGIEAPLAFMCILDNNADHRFHFSHLDHRLKADPADPRVIRLTHSAHAAPR